MTLSIVKAHKGTGIGGVTATTIAQQVLDFEGDFSVLAEGAGMSKYVDLTADKAQSPSSVRIQQKPVADVFRRVGMPNGSKPLAGTDTVVEVLDIWNQHDSVALTDTPFPARAGLTFTIPAGIEVKAADVRYLIGRLIGSLANAEGDLDAGIEAILRGAVRK